VRFNVVPSPEPLYKHKLVLMALSKWLLPTGPSDWVLTLHRSNRRLALANPSDDDETELDSAEPSVVRNRNQLEHFHSASMDPHLRWNLCRGCHSHCLLLATDDELLPFKDVFTAVSCLIVESVPV